ncbi:hypothetical protein DFH09DRAFT_1079585 [Mycena vulgaris]|nr:hypothetical protein DFH09DRAFT_1079585 [Mycena vulgaris]
MHSGGGGCERAWKGSLPKNQEINNAHAPIDEPVYEKRFVPRPPRSAIEAGGQWRPPALPRGTTRSVYVTSQWRALTDSGRFCENVSGGAGKGEWRAWTEIPRWTEKRMDCKEANGLAAASGFQQGIGNERVDGERTMSAAGLHRCLSLSRWDGWGAQDDGAIEASKEGQRAAQGFAHAGRSGSRGAECACDMSKTLVVDHKQTTHHCEPAPRIRPTHPGFRSELAALRARVMAVARGRCGVTAAWMRRYRVKQAESPGSPASSFGRRAEAGRYPACVHAKMINDDWKWIECRGKMIPTGLIYGGGLRRTGAFRGLAVTHTVCSPASLPKIFPGVYSSACEPSVQLSIKNGMLKAWALALREFNLTHRPQPIRRAEGSTSTASGYNINIAHWISQATTEPSRPPWRVRGGCRYSSQPTTAVTSVDATGEASQKVSVSETWFSIDSDERAEGRTLSRSRARAICTARERGRNDSLKTGALKKGIEWKDSSHRRADVGCARQIRRLPGNRRRCVP